MLDSNLKQAANMLQLKLNEMKKKTKTKTNENQISQKEKEKSRFICLIFRKPKTKKIEKLRNEKNYCNN